MDVVSLFAGIEGIGLAFHRAGFRVAAAVEIDHAARGVIHDRMPDTHLFTDIREVTGDAIRAAGFDPDDGVVTAGWPCTDLSVAGLRLGLGGARSGLYWEVVRILGALRPRWFCLENVPGLLSAVCPCPGRPHSVCGGPCADGPHQLPGGACGPRRCMELHGGAMGAVLGSLAELGYGVAYRVLDAQHFGVPQRRRRVVIVGCLGDWATPVEVLLEPEGGGGHPAPGRTARARATPSLTAGSGGGRYDKQPLTVAGPLQAEGADGRGHRIDAEGAANGHLVVAPTLTAGMGSNVGHPGDAGKDEIVLAVASAIAPTLTRHHGRNTPDQETLLPVAFDTAQITSAVNRVNPQPAAPSLPLAASALATTKRDAVLATTAVRRLTPTECERLQGLPDGWTATSWGKPQSDSARYRQLGNSVAVLVFEWVARRIARKAH